VHAKTSRKSWEFGVEPQLNPSTPYCTRTVL
jgi:hypothetical protein